MKLRLKNQSISLSKACIYYLRVLLLLLSQQQEFITNAVSDPPITSQAITTISCFVKTANAFSPSAIVDKPAHQFIVCPLDFSNVQYNSDDD